MADRVITTEALITARDGTGDTFARIAAKIEGIAKAAKRSEAVDQLAASLQRAEKQLQAIAKFDSARSGLVTARGKFRETQAQVEALGKAIRGIEKPTRAMTLAYKTAQNEVSSASRAFEKQASATKRAKAALEGFGVPIGKVAAEQARLKATIESTTHALEQQLLIERKAPAVSPSVERHAAVHGETGRQILGGIVSAALAGEAGHLLHETLSTYGAFDRERRYAKVVMGLTDEQQRPLVDQAIHGGGTTKFNDVQFLESQRELGARGYNKDQVLAFTPIAAQIAQAFDTSMPEGVKALEGAMLGFRKDTSTYAEAVASAQRTADLQVKASKVSGMNFEDIVNLYKGGAAPAQMAHLSEESLLAFGAIAKKGNMGGDESGIAFKALVKNLLTPTHEAKTALMANGIDFAKFQIPPKAMNLDGFASEVARNYGVKLSDSVIAGIGKIFDNPAMVSDPSKFTPAVVQFLQGALGGKDAKSLKSISSLAGRFRDDSVGGVDANGLLAAIVEKMHSNPALANAWLGSKQGGRAYTALGDPALYKQILDLLKNHSQGFAGVVSDARMTGFDAEVQKLTNSFKLVETSIGRAFDAGGSGGLLTDVTAMAARLTQGLAEAPPKLIQMGTAAGAAGAAILALKGVGLLQGGFGLAKSAGALDGAAVEQTAAARELMVAAGEQKAAARLGGGRGGVPGVPEEVPGVPEEVPGVGGVPGEPSKTNLAPGLRSRALWMAGAMLPLAIDAYTWMSADAEGRKKIDDAQADSNDQLQNWANKKIGGLRPAWLKPFLPFEGDRAESFGPPIPPGGLPGHLNKSSANLVRRVQTVPVDPASIRGAAAPAGVIWDYTLGNHQTFSSGYGADGHFDPWPRHKAPAFEPVRTMPFSGRDAEAARGMAMMRTPLAASHDGPLQATLTGPIDVTGKVSTEIQGSITARIDVKVDGGKVTGQYIGTTGPVKANLGRSMPDTYSHR